MSAVKLKAARDARIQRAAHQEDWWCFNHSNRNFAAAARWDRAYLRALADDAKAVNG